MVSPAIAAGGLTLMLGVLTLGGCSGHAAPSQPATSPPVATTSPTPTPADPPWVSAYTHFHDAAYAAARRPVRRGQPYPAGADFTPYSFDPARAQFRTYINGLAASATAFRGTPPQAHISVQSTDLQATPWPKAILSDCETGQQAWSAYNTKTKRKLPTVHPKIPPPYPGTVTMIEVRGTWGVQSITLDTSRTCTA
jgi:hypothetical protein